MSAEASERIVYLAEPRGANKDYQYERSVYTHIKPATMNAEPSDRIVQLAGEFLFFFTLP